MLSIGELVGERYRIISLIGQGGMALVYRAEDTILSRQVALKVLKDDVAEDPKALRRFKKEACTAARLSHPYLVTVHDMVNQGKLHYIVMELVEGITLKNYLSKAGHLSNEETINIALQILLGISEAHKKGIIHRDIKPQNIIISEDGRIKITDFGVAVGLEKDNANPDEILGSAHYIAPEQVEDGKTDARSDLYSLGICIYEMITGKLPFDANEMSEIVKAHLSKALVPPIVYNKEIYPSLNDIIIKAISREPDYRYQNAEEMIDDLNHSLKDPERHFVRFYDSKPSGSHIEGAAEDVTYDTLAASSEAIDNKKTSPYDSNHSPASLFSEGEGKSILDKAKSGDVSQNIEEKSLFLRYRRLLFIGGVLATVFIVVGFVAYYTFLRSGRARLTGSELSALGSGSVSTNESNRSIDMGESLVDINIEGGNIMPDFLGMDLNEAEATLYEMNRSVDSSSTTYSDIYERGTVAVQSPQAGVLLSPGTKVYLTVSLGSQKDYVLENIQGKTLEEAESEIQAAGINVLETRPEFSETIMEGSVIGYESVDSISTSTDDGANREESEGQTSIRLVVSLGSQSNYLSMPDLRGMSLSFARETLLNQELSLGVLTTKASDTVAVGYVIDQGLAPGSFIKRGSAVDLIVSVGNNSTLADGTVVSEDYFSPINTGSDLGEVEDAENYFYGNIDSVCTVGDPGNTEIITVGVRLRQIVDGTVTYTQLEEPVSVTSGSSFPVYFLRIRGAYGVGDGYVEVYDVSNGTVLYSYHLSFEALNNQSE